MSDDRQLFWSQDIRNLVEGQKQAAIEEITKYDENRLLNTPTGDLVRYIFEKYSVEVPVLDLERKNAKSREVTYDISDYGSRLSVTGTCISLTIPFSGEATMFRFRPTSWTTSPPRGQLSYQNLVLEITGRQLTSEAVRNDFDKQIAEVQKYLDWQRATIDQFTTELEAQAKNTIEARKQKLLADRELLAGIGFPIAARSDASKTYAAPVTRKRVYTPPPASSAPYKPEPVLDEANYQAILGIVSTMTSVMERSPSAFATMGEEDLRQHYLMHLNGHFEGAASGETFNFQGKTDILIRVQDRNIFIAECKFWRGEKGFAETIDQILGYLSWRDTKAAVLIFNRNKRFTEILAKIKVAMDGHAHKKRGPLIEGDSRFRYVMSNPADHGREVILTVLAFEVPSTSK